MCVASCVCGGYVCVYTMIEHDAKSFMSNVGCLLRAISSNDTQPTQKWHNIYSWLNVFSMQNGEMQIDYTLTLVLPPAQPNLHI